MANPLTSAVSTSVLKARGASGFLFFRALRFIIYIPATIIQTIPVEDGVSVLSIMLFSQITLDTGCLL